MFHKIPYANFKINEPSTRLKTSKNKALNFILLFRIFMFVNNIMILEKYLNRTAERIVERAQEIGLQFIFCMIFILLF